MRLPDISWLPGPTSFREPMCLNLSPCGSLGPVCARLRGGGTAVLGAARLYAPGPGIPRVPLTSNAPPSRRSVVDKKGFDFDFVPRSTISSNESFLTYCVAGGFMRASAGGRRRANSITLGWFVSSSGVGHMQVVEATKVRTMETTNFFRMFDDMSKPSKFPAQ